MGPALLGCGSYIEISVWQWKDVSMILGILSMLVVMRAGPLWSDSSVCVFMVWCGYEIGESDGGWYG